MLKMKERWAPSLSFGLTFNASSCSNMLCKIHAISRSHLAGDKVRKLQPTLDSQLAYVCILLLSSGRLKVSEQDRM